MLKPYGYIGVCLSLAGCADLPILPTAPASIALDVKAAEALKLQILSDHRDQNNLLLFLSRGRSGGSAYGCGDPKDPRYQIIKEEDKHTRADIRSALKLIDEYAKVLDSIQNRDKEIKKYLDALSKTATAVGTMPGAPPYAAAGNALIKISGDIVTANDVFQAQVAVAGFVEKKGLNTAIELLKKNTTALEGGGLIAFQLWDECARETLAYIRDVPIGKVNGYTTYVVQSSGVELKNAYNDYLVQRAAFRAKVPKFDDDLTSIIKQNQALAEGQLSDISGFITLLTGTFTDGQAINKVVNGT